MNEFRLLSTSGILGYGFPEASLTAARRPIDTGSSFATMVPCEMPI